MALTYQFQACDLIKGPYQGSPALAPYHVFRGTLTAAGTYATGGNQLDFTNFFVPKRMAFTSMTLTWCKSYGDYYDGTNSLTVSDANVALANGGSATTMSSASTGNLVTLKLFTGSNGAGGSEVANATALNGSFTVLFACQLVQAGVNV